MNSLRIADFAVPETQTSTRIPYLWGYILHLLGFQERQHPSFIGPPFLLEYSQLQNRLRKAGVAALVHPVELLDTLV